MKTNVAFYINSKVCDGVDLSTIFEGNPGIGGTEYTTIVLATLLAKDYNTIIYSDSEIKSLDKSIDNIVALNVVDAIKHFDCHSGGIFIYLPRDLSEMIFEETRNTKFVIWRHLDNLEMTYNKRIGASDKVAANVFLTKHQSYRYAPFRTLLKKSVLIGHFAIPQELEKREGIGTNNVTFIGATKPAQSLDKLISIWKKVVFKIPNAHLYVCGSSSLYNKRDYKNIFGVTNYEKNILDIINSNNLVKSITFLGTADKKLKNEIILSTKVGVANPSNVAIETFCLSALDFATCSVPVVSGDYGGLIDTLPRKCGYRIKTKKQLYKSIVKLLRDDKKNKIYGNNYYSFVKSKYSIEQYKNNWSSIIKTVFDLYDSPYRRLIPFCYNLYIFNYVFFKLSIYIKKFLRR